MFAAGIVAVLAAAAVPQLTTGVERARAAGAARYLAGRLAFARSQAVARSVNVAVVLAASRGSFTTALYADGNGNGVRTRDVGTGADEGISAPVRLSDLFPGVQLFLNDPATVSTQDAGAVLSFTPIGTATSRTLYVRGEDGSLYAVRVLGATGRTRLLRYVPASRTWTEVL